jgi:protease PrsW
LEETLTPPRVHAPQPRGKRSWLLWTAALLLATLHGVGVLVFDGMGLHPMHLLIGMVVAVLPVPIYLALALWLDRFEAEPAPMLAGAFLWGATVAVLWAILFEILAARVVGFLAGPQAAALFMTVIAAPFVEELAKGVALLLLFHWKKDEFDGIVDGIIYATMVGLGFAMTENIAYYGHALGQMGVMGSVVVVLRGIITPFLHPLFTAFTGMGLGWARVSSSRAVRILAPLGGLALAMFFHCFWNFTATFGGFLLSYPLVMVPVFLVQIQKTGVDET